MVELYHAENCPYCVKVRVFLEGNGVSYVSHPVSLNKVTPVREQLSRVGGKVQVPFLVDKERNVQMYESDDIIEHIKKNYLNAS